MAASPIFVGSIKVNVVQILPADTTAKKALWTGGASGSKCVALMACSDDTAARVVVVSIKRSAVNYTIGAVSIPAGAGTDGVTPAVDLLGSVLMPGLPVDNDGEKFLFLQSASDELDVNCTTTVTAAKTLHFTALGGDM